MQHFDKYTYKYVVDKNVLVVSEFEPARIDDHQGKESIVGSLVDVDK